MPVLDIGATSLTDARQIVEYYDARAPDALRLEPADPAAKDQAKALFDECFDELGVAVRAWAYTYQLPLRTSTARTWAYRAPRLERIVVTAAYPLLAAIVKRSLKLRDDGIPAHRARIDATLDRVEAQLSDRRRYLTGERLSAADLAFASLVAPAVLAPEYSGPMPAIDELPAPMRREVEQIRARPAGQFALRLYREDRGAIA